MQADMQIKGDVESAEIYRAYFEEMPALVTIQDSDLRIIDSNRHFRDLLEQPISSNITLPSRIFLTLIQFPWRILSPMSLFEKHKLVRFHFPLQ